MSASGSNDYCPIVDESDVAEAAGILGRVRRRRQLTPMRQGCERVVLDENGSVVAGGGSLTAGEKYWARGARVVSVDVGEHILHCSVAQYDPFLSAGFVVNAAVRARVRSSVDVVRANIRSVSEFLVPAFQHAVHDSSEGARADVATNDEIATLHNARLALEARLRRQLMRGEGLTVPSWLEARVSTVAVSFDESTAAHVADLEREVRKAKVDELNRKAAIASRDDWRTALSGMLSGPATRALETMLDNPTPDRIEAAADRLDDLDRTQRAEVFDVLKNAMDRHYVTNLDEIKSIRVLLESFGMISGGVPSGQITEGAGESETGNRPPGTVAEDEDEVDDEDPKDWADLP